MRLRASPSGLAFLSSSGDRPRTPTVWMPACWERGLPLIAEDNPESTPPEDSLVVVVVGKRRWNTWTQPTFPPASTRVQPPPRDTTFTSVLLGRFWTVRDSAEACSLRSVARFV